MLQFRKWISEDFQGTHRTGALGAPNGIDDGTVNIFNLADPKVLDLLDAYVGSITEKTYVNPYTPLRALQTKLSIIGLNFSDNINITDGMEVELPLTQFGGRYGRLSDESAEIGFDDGITHVLGHGLALQISCYKEENHRWAISASIVPTGLDEPMDDYSMDDGMEETAASGAPAIPNPLGDKQKLLAKQTMIGKETGMSVSQAKRILGFKEAADALKEASFKAKCMECGKTFTTSSYDPKCPKCGGYDIELDESLKYQPSRTFCTIIKEVLQKKTT